MVEITLFREVFGELNHVGPVVVVVEAGEDFFKVARLLGREPVDGREQLRAFLFEVGGFQEKFDKVAPPAAEIGFGQAEKIF